MIHSGIKTVSEQDTVCSERTLLTDAEYEEMAEKLRAALAEDEGR